MNKDGIASMSHGKTALWDISLPESDVSEELANLDIGNGTANPFAAYDPEPPPAPKLKSKGVVAMDITEQFVDAARSMTFTWDFFIITC